MTENLREMKIVVVRQAERNKNAVDPEKREELTSPARLRARLLRMRLEWMGIKPHPSARFVSFQRRSQSTDLEVFGGGNSSSGVPIEKLNNLTSNDEGSHLRERTYGWVDRALERYTHVSEEALGRERMRGMLYGPCTPQLLDWVRGGVDEMIRLSARHAPDSGELHMSVICHTWWGDLFSALCRVSLVQGGIFRGSNLQDVRFEAYPDPLDYGEAIVVKACFDSEAEELRRVLGVQRIWFPASLKTRDFREGVIGFMQAD